MGFANRLLRLAWIGFACVACLGDSDRQSLYGCGGVGGELEVTSPDGGEVWAKGHEVTILWRGAAGVESVRIDLLHGDAVVATIAESQANTGALDGYLVPDDLPDGDSYRVRVSSAGDSALADESDDGFRIEARDLAVTSPNGGEQLLSGRLFALAWTSVGSIDVVDVELVNEAGDVVALAAGVANTGEMQWTPSFDLEPATDYRIRVVDPLAHIDDQSDELFALDNWRYRRALTFSSGSEFPATDLAVLVEIEPSAFEFVHAAADGADLRFAGDEGRANGYDVTHYTEEWSAATGARIWVQVPSLPASGSVTLHMYYGAPTAPDASHQEATLPNSFESSGDLTLGGVHEYGTFRLRAAHTLTVEPGAPLEIRARTIEIDGVIDGNGAGYAGGDWGEAGDGPGGGGTSYSGGGGGAGYGGHGGEGGWDSGDVPGSGGAPYGGATGGDFEMGSGGGGSDSRMGGDGGGAVALVAHSVTVGGDIEVNGFAGSSCTSSRCGGGGAGGGVLIEAHAINISGSVQAVGGDGGRGYTLADDCGGGGGGGRIKLLYGGSLNDTGSLWVLGGDAGGVGAQGQPGGEGTSHLQALARWEPAVDLGAEVVLFP